jgi:hypothetical protein
MEFNFNKELLQILNADEIIILSIIKHFKIISKVQLLEIYSKITANKLDKIIRILIKNKYIFFGKNYTLKIYSGDVLEGKSSIFGREVFQKLPSINLNENVNLENFKSMTIYKDNINIKNKNKNKNKENNIKNIIKEKEKFIKQNSNEIVSNKIGYKVYELNKLLQIINPEIPVEYVTNLFYHFESQNFESSGTLITNLKTRIELYFKKNWYLNFLPTIKNGTNTANTNFEQRIKNIQQLNDEIRAYGLAPQNSD